ncbi:MAG: ROK family transcriptional regulator [Silicimonas sp.]|nr:ROK family transcriptional regulator [Silicimonas sp.]
MRDTNARVVLSFIRRHGALPSAEIARRSGLSAQTVSNIIRALETDGLLKREQAVKGKVGKPSIPMALDPKGVFSLGLNIGRRTSELVLVDFNGTRIAARTTTYAFPEIERVFSFLTTGIKSILDNHPEAKPLIAGIGVASPNKIWEWLEVVDAPQDAMRKWQDLDIADEIKARTGLSAVTENDATSACVAEHLIGRGSEFADFAYIFVGSFVGGGLVLGNKVISGPTHSAAGIGPLPVPDGKGGTTQLLNVASLYVLERNLANAGLDPKRLRQFQGDWSDFADYVAPWIEDTGRNLAIAAAAIASVVEVEAVLLDGAMPEAIRHRLTECTRRNFSELDTTGIGQLRIEEAATGPGARSVGAALLPIHSKYFLA